jgi:hypothetical protein
VVYRLVIGSRRGLTCLVPWTAVPTFEPSEVQLRDVGPLDPFLIGRGENRRTADVDGRHFQRTPKRWRISPTRRTDEPEQIVDLGALADAAATRATRRTGRQVRVEAEHTVVRGRRQGLERAIGNLLENAAKFDDGDTPSRYTSAAAASPSSTAAPASTPPTADTSSTASTAPTGPGACPDPASACPSSTTSRRPTAARYSPEPVRAAAPRSASPSDPIDSYRTPNRATPTLHPGPPL